MRRGYGLWRIVFIVLSLALVAWTFGWVSVPPPPERLNTLALQFVQHAAPPLYWELFATHLMYWLILRMQRRPGETGAARWLRVFLLSKAFLWLVLAAGRSILQDWLTVGYALVVLYIVIASTAALIALVWTYVIPIYRKHSSEHPPIDEVVLPKPVQWTGTERRDLTMPGRRITDKGHAGK